MARTRRTRPSARSASGSRSSAELSPPVPRLLLASASPRRRELLALLGVDFDVLATGVEEETGGDPAATVLENARRKARAGVARDGGERPVLGVDTDVALDGTLLGKPESAAAAARRLRALSGRTHEVFGGLALISGGVEDTDLARTAVTFRSLTEAEIDAYVSSGEWRDRAGGYAVQGLGSALVAAVDGDLSNVIGLPIPALSRMIAGLQDR